MTEIDYWRKLGTHKLGRRRALRGAAIGTAGLAAAALIGCSGDDAETPPAGGAGTSPAGGSPAAGTPKIGGRLQMATDGDPPDLDLHSGTSTTTNFLVAPAYNQLVQFDPTVAVDVPQGIVADLAKSWQVSPDGLTYTFTLVQNAKFHNGAPLVAADVKASFERQKSPPSSLLPPRKAQLANYSFETPDNYTVVMKLAKPQSPLTVLPIIGQGWMSILSAKDIAGGFDFKTNMNGTGPYRFVKYERGNRVSMDKNKEYHVANRPYPDGLDGYIIPTRSTYVAQTQSGALHVYRNCPIQQLNELKKILGDKADYVSHSAYSIATIHFHAGKAPWGDQRARLAVAKAISKQEFLDTAGFGDGDMGGHMSPKGGWTLSQQDLEKIPGYEPYSEAGLADAKKLWAAAGGVDGLKQVLISDIEKQDSAIVVAEQLRKLGIVANVDITERATWFGKLNKNEFDIGYDGPGFALDDPDAIYAENYVSDAPRNYSRLPSTKWDDLFQKQSVEMDSKKRLDMVKDMQKAAMPDLGNVILRWAFSMYLILSF